MKMVVWLWSKLMLGLHQNYYWNSLDTVAICLQKTCVEQLYVHVEKMESTAWMLDAVVVVNYAHTQKQTIQYCYYHSYFISFINCFLFLFFLFVLFCFVVFLICFFIFLFFLNCEAQDMLRFFGNFSLNTLIVVTLTKKDALCFSKTNEKCPWRNQFYSKVGTCRIATLLKWTSPQVFFQESC